VARYAPNRATRQVARWVVGGDPAQVHRIAELYATRVRPLVHQPW
jgi:hypothetical protein